METSHVLYLIFFRSYSTEFANVQNEKSLCALNHSVLNNTALSLRGVVNLASVFSTIATDFAQTVSSCQCFCCKVMGMCQPFGRKCKLAKTGYKDHS